MLVFSGLHYLEDKRMMHQGGRVLVYGAAAAFLKNLALTERHHSAKPGVTSAYVHAWDRSSSHLRMCRSVGTGKELMQE